MNVPSIRFCRQVLFVLLAIGLTFNLTSAMKRDMAPNADKSGPMDGPLPPPGSQIECFSIVDGVQLSYHRLDHPIPNAPEVIRATFLRYGQEVEVRGIVTGDEHLKAQGRRLVRTVLESNGGSWYKAGGLCACVPIGFCGCSESCGGPGCVQVKAKND